MTASESTWSNPKGEVLTTVVTGRVWAAQRPFVWNGIDVGGKMGVVKLTDGSLWVHSPVSLDAELTAALAQLGRVEHVVAPNYEHVKYVAQWAAQWPDAHVYGCPGLRDKQPELPLTASVGDEHTAATWPAEVQYRWLDCEVNPATGTPFFNEVVFHHAPTATLFVTDAFWNYPAHRVPPQTWLWKQGMDRVYLPFYRTLMTRGREEAYGEAVDAVLAWAFTRVVPCHGTVIEEGAHAAIRAHLLSGEPQSGTLV